MTVMAPSLERFFEHMVPFLEGRTNTGQLTDVLGPSASGLKRLTFYRTLICRDTAWILGGLFPATRAACDLHQAGLWDDLVARYSREHYPVHWDPNPFGAQFAEYIEALAESGEPIPSYLYETADYEWISYATGVAPDLSPADAEDIGLDRTLFVRHYAHNIPQFACRAEGSDTAALVHAGAYLLSIGHQPNGDAISVNCSKGYPQRRQAIAGVTFSLSTKASSGNYPPTLAKKVTPVAHKPTIVAPQQDC